MCYCYLFFGSANFTSDKIFHVLSNNLLYQSRQHLLSDMAVRSYSETIGKMQGVCTCCGVQYKL